MNPRATGRFVEAIAEFLNDDDLTQDEEVVWMTMRTGQPNLAQRVHALLDEYLDADIALHDAMGWFLLNVPAADAQAYTWRNWTPVDLLDLRRAMRQTQRPHPKDTTPLDAQTFEVDWIYTDIGPSLVPLFVLHGSAPEDVQAITRDHLGLEGPIIAVLRVSPDHGTTPA